MKNLLLTPLFKLFKKSTFLLSLNQNSCPVLDAEDIKKQELIVKKGYGNIYERYADQCNWNN